MDISERIYLLRNELNLSQEAFGTRINVTKFSISSYEKGKNAVKDRVISDICREFNVNEDWLRTGEGDMFNKLSTAELAANIVGKALTTDNEFMHNVFIALGQMSTEQWTMVENFVNSIKTNKN